MGLIGRYSPGDVVLTEEASTHCSVQYGQSGQRGVNWAGLKGGASLAPDMYWKHQSRGFSHQKSWNFSAYYETIGGLLYYDAFEGGRAGPDAFMPPRTETLIRTALEVSMLRQRQQSQGTRSLPVRRSAVGGQLAS